MHKAFAAFFAFLALTCTARAETVYAKIPAHPALWTVHGPKGTAYLFGSVHLLPPEVDWHTKEVDAAIAKSDTLVFELAMDDKFQARMQDYIKARGMLPEGQHLHDMLPPETNKALDAEIAKTHIPPVVIDRMRPWLAELTLEVAEMGSQNYAAGSGVDVQIQAKANGRPVIGLETIEDQMALIAPSDPKKELESFEADLKTSGSEANNEIGPLVDAWMHGRVDRLAALTKKEFQKYPDAQKSLFDDRNAAWVKKITALLDEPKTYFITVGAGHLAGPQGVPAVLRAKGFRVDGP
ncbi:MAG TPA: TraB/GumN family protein [Rhizomicrobium sp.]|nr:TraB/GumN family protein [Rhizomicrobium sp.]